MVVQPGRFSLSLAPWPVALLTALVGAMVLAPIGILLYQSLLTAPFFAPVKSFALEAYRYILHDPYFFEALRNSLFIGLGMVLVAVPLGSLFAFLVTKTDLPLARLFELLLLAPIFISAIILAIGFIVAFGPSGLVSGWVEGVLGRVPWTIYTWGFLRPWRSTTRVGWEDIVPERWWLRQAILCGFRRGWSLLGTRALRGLKWRTLSCLRQEAFST